MDLMYRVHQLSGHMALIRDNHTFQDHSNRPKMTDLMASLFFIPVKNLFPNDITVVSSMLISVLHNSSFFYVLPDFCL